MCLKPSKFKPAACVDDLCGDIWSLQPCLSGQGLSECCAELRMGFGAVGIPGPRHNPPEGAGAEGGPEPAAIFSVPLQKAVN